MGFMLNEVIFIHQFLLFCSSHYLVWYIKKCIFGAQYLSVASHCQQAATDHAEWHSLQTAVLY
jgi:hypothetical protein